MTNVRHILRTKGDDVVVADPALTVREALRMMERGNVGSLVVIEDGGLVGLFTERDFARRAASTGPPALEAALAEVMVRDVLVVSPDTSIDECMALMTDKRTRHLPVFEDERVVGIVSIGDIVKGLIADKEFMIEQLERYITGR